MAKSTFGTLVALCGHEYQGYSGADPWPHCERCMRAMRLAMKLDNERRAYLLAAMPKRRDFKVSKAKRLRIYERDGWICRLCFEPVDPNLDPSHNMAASLDHIVCRSWGGSHSESNLRLSHRLCNARRGDEGRWAAANRALCVP